ncbi:hypothetical protein AB6A23_18215 [Paenibacillus tarimensis]
MLGRVFQKVNRGKGLIIVELPNPNGPAIDGMNGYSDAAMIAARVLLEKNSDNESSDIVPKYFATALEGI